MQVTFSSSFALNFSLFPLIIISLLELPDTSVIMKLLEADLTTILTIRSLYLFKARADD